MIRNAVILSIRIAGASMRAFAWLLLAIVMLSLFMLGMVWIIASLAFKSPMMIWRAASNQRPPIP